MKTWLVGILVFALWSAGCAWWYVCKVKGQCWGNEGQPSAVVGALPPTSTGAPAGGGLPVGIGSGGLSPHSHSNSNSHSNPNTTPSGTSAGGGPSVGFGPEASRLDSTLEPEPKPKPLLPSPAVQRILLARPYVLLFNDTVPAPVLEGDWERYLASLAAFLKANPARKARIAGHTDAPQGADGGLLLATHRCAVAQALIVTQGVAPAQLVSLPVGMRDSVARNASPAGRRLNNRVVISLQD